MPIPFPLPLPIVGKLAWKIGVGIAAIASLVLAFLLVSTTIEKNNLRKERDKLSLSITHPQTGYIVRLSQARTNVITLEHAIKVQNEALIKNSNASKAELNRLKKELVLAQAETRRMERRLSVFMATKPQGVTLEQRVNDIDRRILEDLRR